MPLGSVQIGNSPCISFRKEIYIQSFPPPQEYKESLFKKFNDVNVSADMLLLHACTKRNTGKSTELQYRDTLFTGYVVRRLTIISMLPPFFPFSTAVNFLTIFCSSATAGTDANRWQHISVPPQLVSWSFLKHYVTLVTDLGIAHTAPASIPQWSYRWLHTQSRGQGEISHTTLCLRVTPQSPVCSSWAHWPFLQVHMVFSGS